MAETFVVQPMRVEHLPVVSAIERLSFSQPWPMGAYRKEIEGNRMAYYVVARSVDDDPPLEHNGADAPRARAASASHTVVSVPEKGLLDRLARLLRPSDVPPSPELQIELQSLVGYAGLWLMHDEAHVTTIAVHPNHRGKGVGELLLVGLIEHAVEIGAKWMTLEVRVSNEVAQALYRKYTFKEMGIRRGYYSDDREDAMVMWSDPLDSPSFQETVARNRDRLAQRMNRRA